MRERRHPFPAIRNIALSAALALGAARAQEWTPVTDGKSGAGLYHHGQGAIEYSPAGIIKVSGGNGYLATRKEFTHFRTRVEWNNARGGNSGFLFHIVEDAVWPVGLECQMHSRDVGSVWTTHAVFNSTGSDSTYSATGAPITAYRGSGARRSHFIRSQDPGAAVGRWNVWEMYVRGDSLEIKVNGKVTMRLWKLAAASGAPIVKGRMGLQIEGAAVEWRNWMVQDLSATTRLGPAAPAGRLRAPDRGFRLRILDAGGGPVMAAAGLPGAFGGGHADLKGRAMPTALLPAHRP